MYPCSRARQLWHCKKEAKPIGDIAATGAVAGAWRRCSPGIGAGAETFIVKDPDGNLLLFAGPAD